MDLNRIVAALEQSTPESVRSLLDDRATVFWVDWREEDDEIIRSCESRLQTGCLTPETVPVESEERFHMYVQYRDNRVRVPLSYSARDRHITLLALNQALAPKFEVRLCADSLGSDTLAFLPLASEQWAQLEREHGDAVGKRFHKLAESPNWFTDPWPPPAPPVTWQQLAADSTQKMAAIKAYCAEHGVGIGDAKKAVDRFIAESRSSRGA